MRMTTITFAAGLTMAWATASLAAGGASGVIAAKPHAQLSQFGAEVQTISRRSGTTRRDGTCRRSNGTATASLNLKDKCDRQEFLARQRDRR